MEYFEGTIIKKQNIVFKGTEKLDFRIGGHPVLLPVATTFDDGYIYYFTLSSQTHRYPSNPKRYFPLKKHPGSGLKTNSLVDLKYVYKSPRENVPEMGTINEHILKEVITKFLDYQETEYDQECNELLALIS